MDSMNWLTKHLKRLALSAIGHRRDRRQHPPKFRVVAELGSRSPSVYYLCPDTNKPSGGIRTIYQHVDVLNSIGISAAVVHHHRGFACTWFEHETKVAAAAEISLTSSDLLVVPEFYIPYIREMPAEPRLIVFNQGAYVSFDGREAASSWRFCIDNSKLEAILVVSLDNHQYVQYAFPGIRSERVRNAIDSRVFYPADSIPGRRIAVMPRRRGKELCAHTLSLLELRGALDGWEIISIDNYSQQETANILRSSAIFLSFSEREGFGLPPAEAMACGCYVVGFTGLGGREFFYPGLCSQVEEGNVFALARAAEAALKQFEIDATSIRQRALKASAIIRDEYSPERQILDLKAFFESVDLRPRGRASNANASHQRS
jgi:glycosyltransferase involved in cell wall biosynthesis